MLKVAIDSGPLHSSDSVRGIGTYTRELLKALKMEGIDVSKADLSKYDIVHFTRFRPFFVSLPFSKPKNTKFVLTIYDLIPLIYPKHYPPGMKGWFRWQINKYLIKRNVDAIITISETSKKDICRFIGVEPSKVTVIYLAAPPVVRKLPKGSQVLTRAKDKFKLPDKFALYIGDINYNKNIPNLVKASRLARIPLVIIGKQITEIVGEDLDHPELAHLRGIDFSDIIKLGYIDYEDLSAVMNLASVYVQPSFYEGFGIPLMEAANCGTPIVATKNQCHVEILGEDFSYVNPTDPKSIAEGILHPNKNKELPRDYSWDITARETMKVYKQLYK